MSFEAFFSRILRHFEPLRGSALRVLPVMKYRILLIFCLLEEKLLPCITDYSYYSYFLRGAIIPIIYITIYILISYIEYKEGIPSRLLTVITVIVIAVLFTSLPGPLVLYIWLASYLELLVQEPLPTMRHFSWEKCRILYNDV